jgi:hypothetical protein
MGYKSTIIERHGKIWHIKSRTEKVKAAKHRKTNHDASACNCVCAKKKAFHVGIGKECFQIWRR